MYRVSRSRITAIARVLSLMLAVSGLFTADAQKQRTVSRAQSSGGQTYSETVVYSFATQQYDGINPFSGLIQDQSGNMYGTTVSGGLPTGYLFTCGTVFEITPDGNGGITYSSIYSTGLSSCGPGSLTLDGQGNLYGTSVNGGGTVYELSKASPGNWILSNYYPAGGEPQGAMVDSAGNVYGTTLNGGLNEEGVVFKLQNVDEQWLGQTLFTFNGTGGSYGNGNLLMDQEGNLYGATASGGAYDKGVIFRLHPTKTGWKETILHAFQGGADDGAGVNRGLTFGPDRNIYGASGYGLLGYGGVFQLTKSGKITWIWAFTGGTDGTGTATSVSLDSKGNCYGVSSFIGDGAIFMLSPTSRNQTTPWTFNLLYTFSGGAEGDSPIPPFVVDNRGNIYGVTYGGGIDVVQVGAGVIFKLTPNPVATNVSITRMAPSPSLAGQVVKINFTVAQAVAGYNAPTGTVTVSASTGEGCSTPLPLNGKGSCELMFATSGTRELTASYFGDAGNLASVSAAVTENTESPTTTEITRSAPDPAKIGEAVTVHFSVSAKSGTSKTKPTGSVTVAASTGESCTGDVAENGNGSCQVTFSSAGVRTLIATYAGDAVNTGSVSIAVAETVN
ncbi:MAG: Ig-like domain-containing protein [Terriglobales bacterium]